MGRAIMDDAGRRKLHQPAPMEDSELLAEAQSLALVMGHMNHSRAEPLVELYELSPERCAERVIEIRERLVQEQDGGFSGYRAAQRNPLPLAAGKLGGAAVQQLVDAEYPGHGMDPLAPLAAHDAPGLESKTQVVEDAEVRIKRGVLEDHGHIAAVRGDAAHVMAADQDCTRVWRFEPGDQPQERGLARSGGAQHHQALARGDDQVECVEGRDVRGIASGGLTELDGRHDTRPPPRATLRLTYSCPDRPVLAQ